MLKACPYTLFYDKATLHLNIMPREATNESIGTCFRGLKFNSGGLSSTNHIGISDYFVLPALRNVVIGSGLCCFLCKGSYIGSLSQNHHVVSHSSYRKL